LQIKPLYFDSTANWSNIMPIKCPGGQKPRYRWKGGVRLTFCGNKVVETKKKGKKAKKTAKKKR